MEQELTKAQELITRVGIAYKESGVDQWALSPCTFCGNGNYKLYINVSGTEKDGLYHCVVCGESGNLWQLKQKLGVAVDNVTSLKDAESAHAGVKPLPDFDALHWRLLNDVTMEEVLDYAVCTRRFSMDVIKRYKIGAQEYNKKTWMVIPYFDSMGTPIYFKARTIPPAPKEFSAPSGREAALFNEPCLKMGMDELFIVEGECDCLAMLSQGYETVVGVPGAQVKKAAWIEKLDRLAPKQIYLLYDSDKVGQDSARSMAMRIGVDRCKNILLPEFDVEPGVKSGKDINDWFMSGHTLEELMGLKAEAKPFNVLGVQSVVEVLDELRQDLEERGADPKYLTMWPSLNNRVGGFEDGDLVGWTAPEKCGKAQPLSSLIKTKTGWVRMGAIRVGDELASVDGLESRVLGVFPQGMQQVYKVTFSDGRSVRCSGDHLWYVRSANNDTKWQTVTTTTLQDFLERRTKYYIPLCNGDFGCKDPLPLDPWLLGVLIGDGNLCDHTPSVHKLDDFIREGVHQLGYTTTSLPSGFRIYGGGIKESIIALGLNGITCYDKFIPQMYLMADYETRLALLQGLMDTDGTATSRGFASYSTSSELLAHNVRELVWSLGGTSRISTKHPQYTYKGNKYNGAPAYNVSISLHDKERVFRLPRKKQRVLGKNVTKQPRLTIVSVEEDWKEPVQCIAVSHPSRLYITDNYVVTHNTTALMNLLDWYASECGYPSLMLCNEVSPKRMVRKWVSYKTQTDDTPGKSQMTPAVVEGAVSIIPSMKADLLFGYTENKVSTVIETITQAVRRYGVKVVCFDNLQLLVHNMDHYAQEMSKISKMFKELAMKLGILFHLVMQLKRVTDGKIPTSDDIFGSSQPVKDVDANVIFYRKRATQLKQADFNGFIETDDNFEPQVLTRADLTRFAPGGCTTLWMDGARSTVRELRTDDITAVPSAPGVVTTETVNV